MNNTCKTKAQLHNTRNLLFNIYMNISSLLNLQLKFLILIYLNTNIYLFILEYTWHFS